MPLKAKTVNTHSALAGAGGREQGTEVRGRGGGERDLITSGCFNLHGGCHGNISIKLTGIKPEHLPFNCCYA